MTPSKDFTLELSKCLILLLQRAVAHAAFRGKATLLPGSGLTAEFNGCIKHLTLPTPSLQLPHFWKTQAPNSESKRRPRETVEVGYGF